MQLISLSIPYLYLLHVLIISIRVGATLLFAPIWGDPGLPQYLRVVLVFAIAANQWFGSLIEASKQIFIIGWKIALPVFVATFVLEVTVGFISRMQPQINTMVVTAPLKILVGLVILGASMTFVPRAIGSVM